MFCKQCGAELKEGAAFCDKCGAKQEPVQAPEEQAVFIKENSGQTSTHKRTKKAVIGIVAVVVLIAVGNLLFGGRSYKKTIAQYFDATKKCDVDDLLDTVPEQMIKYTAKHKRTTRKEMKEELKEDLEDAFDGDVKLSYEITASENLEDDDLEDLIDQLVEDYDFEEDAVKKAKEVDVTITVEAEDLENETEVTFILVKIGRNWYIADGAL